MLTPMASSSCKFEFIKRRDAANQRHTASGHDSFFDSRPSGVHGVLDASFLLLKLRLGCCAHLDDSYAANQLGQAFLELFFVIVGGGVFDLCTKLPNTSLVSLRLCQRPQ